MNRFSTARGNAPALPAVRRTDRAGDDRTVEGAGSLRTAFGSALFAMPVAAVAGLIFLLIAAGTVCAMPDPDSLITPLGLSSGARAGLYAALVAISCFGALIGRRR